MESRHLRLLCAMLNGCRELALYTSGEGSSATWRSAIENKPEPAYSLDWWNSLPLTNEAVMDEDRFNIEVRQFLKQVGITSQREIERAVREALASGQIEGKEKLKVSARIQIERVALDHEVEGEIALS